MKEKKIKETLFALIISFVLPFISSTLKRQRKRSEGAHLCLVRSSSEKKKKKKKNNFINEINNMKTEHNPYRIANR